MTIDEVKDILTNTTFIAPAMVDVDTAINMAITSLDAWEAVRKDINDLFNKPAFYMPNYDAYKMFLEIIDKHLQEVE